MREIEALGAKLKKSQEELDKCHIQVSWHKFAFPYEHL